MHLDKHNHTDFFTLCEFRNYVMDAPGAPLTDTAAPAFAHIITGIRLDGKPRRAHTFRINACITHTYEHNHID